MSSASVGRDIKTKRFWRSVAANFFAVLGIAATAAQVYDVLDPDEIARHRASAICGAVLLAIVWACYRAWPRPIQQQYTDTNTEIRIVEGDLFEQDTDVVIGMCTTFDTEIPHIIGENSVQGQFLSIIYHGDVASLDSDLDVALAQATATHLIDKPGKQAVFPIGTVAAIRQNRRHFYCVAYTEMNEINEARGTVGGIWRSLDELWTQVRARSNGAPVAIPVIGGGQARISQVLRAQDSIRFIALSFMFASRAERVCERLDIVVRKSDVAKLDMLELRAFLESLVPS